MAGYSAFCCNGVPVVLSEINVNQESASGGRSRLHLPKYLIMGTHQELLKISALLSFIHTRFFLGVYCKRAVSRSRGNTNHTGTYACKITHS